MDQATLTAVVTTSSALIGGAYSGFKFGKSSSLQDSANSTEIATNTVELLQTQVGHLQEQNADLLARVSVLEELVTQRAAVDVVHTEVKASRVVLDKIATKVGA